ncbi:alpha/beta fold hydrolase [Candidatus Woesearchaeota archaeon]|nr:alpha/beta fold hydrolase [Candidatus Woesearchaeota archaeon]
MKKALSLLFLFLIACSAVNIAVDTSIKQGSEGFVVGDGSIGLVLTHGLGATPCEVKDLANYLAGKNITVYVVRLPGHGTSIEELDSKKWEDWYQNYKEAYMTLKPIKSKIFAAGMSVGGVIALKLAEDEDIDGVVALAPALIFDDSRSNYAWFFKYFSKYSSRTLRPECKDNTYDKFSIKSVAESVEFAKLIRKDLDKVTEPTFLMQYKDDDRVKPESSQIVYDSISSEKKELNWIDGKGHVFLLDEDKEKYFEQIYQFIKTNS